MKSFILAFLLLGTLFSITAQQPFKVQFSADQVLPVDFRTARDRKYYIDGDDICIIDAKGFKQELNDLYVSRYDKNTLAFKSNTFIFPKKSLDKSFLEMVYADIIKFNGNYFVLLKNYDRKTDEITYYSIPLDPHFNATGQPTQVLHIAHEKGFGTTRVMENKEHDGFLMLFNNTTAKGEEKGKMFYTLMDTDFKTVSEGSVQMWDKTQWLGWTSDPWAVLSVSRGPANILYDVKEEYNGEYATPHKFAVTAADMNTGESISMMIDQVENPYSASVHADDENIYVYGYTRSGKNEGVDALYITTIVRDGMKIRETKIIPFENDLITQLFYTAKKDSEYRMYGAENVNFLKTSNGGAYVIGEQYEDYSVFSENGSYTVYCRGNIIITKMDAAGNVEWMNTIPRRNSSTDYRRSNIYTELVDDDLVLFYNDKIDNYDATSVNDLKIARLSSIHEKVQLVGISMNSRGEMKKMAIGDDQANNGLFVYPDEITKWEEEKNTFICRVNHKVLKYIQVSMMKISYLD